MIIPMSGRCLECGATCEFAYIRDGLLLGCDRCVITMPIHDYVVGVDEEGGTYDGKGRS